MTYSNKLLFVFVFCFLTSSLHAEDGYRLWLRYDKIDDAGLLQEYNKKITSIKVAGASLIFSTAKEELINGLTGLLGKKINEQHTIGDGTILIGTAADATIQSLISSEEFDKTGNEGFIIRSVTANGKKIMVIAGNTGVGALYGCFHFLRLLQTHQSIQQISVLSAPSIQL
ncbi:MAG TPA: alpha-glucuronidase family glycosyl hydrolase, partial [Agriterribacter sp.]|nr:alpha-glucuronidase family glycosyl hydrolase [Agriterribacter sp.]